MFVVVLVFMNKVFMMQIKIIYFFYANLYTLCVA